MTPLSNFGEWEAVRRMTKALGRPRIPSPHKILAGPGDDAAVVNISTPSRLAFTTDAMVEGTHFRLDWMRRFFGENEVWRALGQKAMAANLSDLAAMGAVRPILALLTFGGRGDISVDTVENLCRGISNITSFFGFSVIGGDTIRSDKTIVSICLVGELITHKQILRNGAGIGDVLMCSGYLGLSMAGLKILEKRTGSYNKHERLAVRRHLVPSPRLKEGAFLGNVENKTTSMIDTSDDLLTSLEILSRESRVGFECDLSGVPVHPALKRISGDLRLSPYSFVLYGGEDYELLFTVPASIVERVRRKIPSSYVLGRVMPEGCGVKILKDGGPFRAKDVRFRHF